MCYWCFSKNAWVVSLKDNKAITVTNAFQKVYVRSGLKPNKVWLDKGSEFYNRSVKLCLQDNDLDLFKS